MRSDAATQRRSDEGEAAAFPPSLRRSVAPSLLPAFTLLEVLITLLLLGVLAAIAWPNFSANRAGEALPESARRFKTLIAMCRAEAMNTARAHRIEFRPDGTIQVRRQLDPVYAPHVFLPVESNWAETTILDENVWVSSITPLTSSPDAVEIEDDEVVALTDFIQEQDDASRRLIGDLDDDFPLEFDSNGLSPTMRWTLRGPAGRGLRLTLDGRLGRVTMEEVAADEDLVRPEKLDPEEDQYAGLSEAEVLKEFLP